MSDQTLTDAGRAVVRRMIEASHVADVIEVCEAYCWEQARHCEQTEGMSAIGKEWERAANRLSQAREEVEL